MGAGIVGRGVNLATGAVDDVAGAMGKVTVLIDDAGAAANGALSKRMMELMGSGRVGAGAAGDASLHTKTMVMGDDIARTVPIDSGRVGASALNHELPIRIARDAANLDAMIAALNLRPRPGAMLVGAPGVGKTALMEDAGRMLNERGFHMKRIVPDADGIVKADSHVAPPRSTVTVGETGPLTQTISEALPVTERQAMYQIGMQASLREQIVGQPDFVKRMYELLTTRPI